MDETDEPRDGNSESPTAAPSAGDEQPGAVREAAEGPERLDLNTATASDLSRLPGVTAGLAERIVEYRRKHGPFQEPAGITRVRGVSGALYERIASLVTVERAAQAPAAGAAREETLDVLLEPPLYVAAPDEGSAATAEPPSTEEPAAAGERAARATEPAVADRRPPPPPLDFTQVEPERRGPGWPGVLALALASALLGACLALAILALLNGALRFGRASAVRGLETNVQQLATSVDQVDSDLAQARGRLDEGEAGLKTVTADVAAMRGELDGLERTLTAAQADLEALRTDLTAMGGNVNRLQRRANALEGQLAAVNEQLGTMRRAIERFDAFLAGLRALLNDGEPVPGPGLGTPAPTGPARPRPTATAVP